VRMNGGDDYVEVFGGTPGDRFDGGMGTDEFAYASAPQEHTSIVFNLASGLLRDTWPGGETSRQAVNFERAVVDNLSRSNPGSTTIKGTSGANWLKAWGPGRITIYGRAGDDELIAYDLGVLIGGRGHDIARAGYGADVRCEAEVTFDC
jgi:Ca2+-binding RTX toxin-like protein